MFYPKSVLATCILAAVSVNAFANDDIKTNEMETIVVSASLTDKTLATAPAFTSVIEAEEIMASAAVSLSDILANAAGVENFSDASGRDELRLRGLGGEYSLVLINGKRISSSSALWRGGDFDLNAVPLNSIERVEIVKGPMSALYGADAIGGVINIITKKVKSEAWQNTLSAMYRNVMTGEGGNEFRLGISSQGALTDSVQLALSAELQDRDAWYIEGKNSGVDSSTLEEKSLKNVSSTLNWQVDEQQSVDLDLASNKDDRPHAIYFSNGTFMDYRAQDISRTTLGLTHFGDWGWGTTRIQLQQENAQIDDFNSRYNDPQLRKLEEENTFLRGVTQFVSQGNTVSIGAEYRKQTVKDDVSFSLSGQAAITDKALFVQDEINIGDALTLTLGGRWDDNEFFGSEFTPRAYAVYQASDNITIKGGYSKAYKAPRAHQLVAEYSIISCGGRCFLTGNPDLEAETSESYEIGFMIRQDTWDLSAVYFNNDVENMIAAGFDPVEFKRFWANLNEVNTSGVELEGSVRVSNEWDVQFNFTQLDTKVNGEQELEGRPENTAKVAVNWELSDDLTVNLAFNHTGKQTIFARPDYKALPSYHRIDLAMSSEFENGAMLNFGVQNLADVQTQEEDASFNTFELGRNLYVNAQYHF